MSKLVKQHLLGDHFITVKQDSKGSVTATLHSGNSFGVLEVQNVNGEIRIKDLEIGSAFVKPHHFAMLLKEAGLSEIVEDSLKSVNSF